MAVAFQASSQGTVSTTSGGTISSGNAPAVGNIIWVGAVNRLTGTTFTSTGDFTQIATITGTNFVMGFFYRVATSTTSSFTGVTISSASNFQHIVGGIITGASDPVTFDSTNSNSQGPTAATGNISFQSLSGGANGGIVLDVIAQSAGGTWTISTHTETTDNNTGTQSTRTTLATSYALVSTNGSTPTGTGTPSSTSGNWGCITVFFPQAVTAPALPIIVQPPRRSR